MPLRSRRVLALILFLAGLVGWPFIFSDYNSRGASAFLTFGFFGPAGLALFSVVVAAIAWIPFSQNAVDRLLTRVNRFTHARPAICSVFASLFSTAYLAMTAVVSHRHLYPGMHDEFSYLIQARQFASGHLWMPAHPLADFFDSFQLLTKPVYASAYFPGTAILHVPGIWLHLPPYVTSLAIAGAIAGLFFYFAYQLIDGVSAWLALLLLLANFVFRQVSVMTLAQLPLLLYSLAATVAWLRWRKTGSMRAAILIGAFLGLAMITRPVDALCFGIPIGVAMLFHQRRLALAAVVAAAIPSLIFQLVLDHGTTGHWLQTPFGLYADRDYPGTTYGFKKLDRAARPVSQLPQKQELYANYRPKIERHKWSNIFDDLKRERLRYVLSQFSPFSFPLLVLLCPMVFFGFTWLRAAGVASLPLWLALYAPYVFFMPHYVVAVAPPLILAILISSDGLINLWGKHRRLARVALTLFIAGEALASLPQFTRPDGDVFGTGLLSSVNAALACLPPGPAVVLFTFFPKRNLDEEPVYNQEVAWPDDATIIRAHDRGAQNHEIYEYYAQRDPQRFFYRFDEASGKISSLGTARDLASRSP